MAGVSSIKVGDRFKTNRGGDVVVLEISQSIYYESTTRLIKFLV